MKFTLLHRVILSSLFVALLAVGKQGWGQPRAPITWGQRRVLRSILPCNEHFHFGGLYAKGDTVVVMMCYVNRQGGPFVDVSISSDNGQNWSPLHIVTDTNRTNQSWVADCAITTNGIYINEQVSNVFRTGLFKSTDLGLNWIAPCTTSTLIKIGGVRNDTIFGIGGMQEGGGGSCWSSDGGCHYSPFRNSGYNYFRFEGQSSFHIHRVAATGGDTLYDRSALIYTRAPLYSGTFEPYQRLNQTVLWTYSPLIDFDNDGNGCIASPAAILGYSDFATIVINTSHDDGVTWSPYRVVSTTESAEYIDLLLNHFGSRWLVTWRDSSVERPQFVRGGSWCAFSANKGYSWYPASQIDTPDSLDGSVQAFLDIQGNRIRLYEPSFLYNGETANFIIQTEGIIHPDTLAPVISSADTILGGLLTNTFVTTTVEASDNDSLWKLDLIMKRLDSTDSLVYPLSHSLLDSTNVYHAQWQTASDTGTFTYYYRAEDMWENVGYFQGHTPDNPFIFQIEYNGIVDSKPLPTRLYLSVYPNPGNATFTITGLIKPTSSNHSIRIIDVLGREVQSIILSKQTGSFNVQWNGKNQSGSMVSTGVYFVTIQPGSLRPQRIVVIR